MMSKMRTRANMAKTATSSSTTTGGRSMNNQHVVFELKQRVVLAMNKLGDRDTYRIGVEELEKTIECLTPDGVTPFLSCILDTDSEKKTAVRKECIRLMGTLACFYPGLIIGSHLAKMVASIVKRLKDSDSVVRDACVETVGVLASKLTGHESDNNEGVFVALVKPLFEALGEQNKHIQCGSALCLARVIDSVHDPPVPIMQKMLVRTIKLLKNPHFMAKPAIIELNRSIVQAGGAPTHGALSTAMTSIQEALKNSDWNTRKAACTALADIASHSGGLFSSFKSSCVRCLESCRFDKVKPVRDIALQALHLWKNLPGPGTSEPSEAGSSIKEIYYRDEYGDVSSASASTFQDITLQKEDYNVVKKRVPPCFRKASQNNVEKPLHSMADDWRIEIAVPKNYNISRAVHNEESEGSSITKACERTNSDLRSTQETEYDFVQVDDKQECYSASNLFPEHLDVKVVKANDSVFHEVSSMMPKGAGQRSAAEETSIEEQRYIARMHDRRSLDSTITEASPCTMRNCCAQTANEITSIRTQLSEIESKQSKLMELLKVFSTSITESLSVMQTKVSNLELVVGKIGQELVHGDRYSDLISAKLLKRSPAAVSPRLSTTTPRSSVDIRSRQPPLAPTRNTEAITGSRSSNANKQGIDMWTNPTAKSNKSLAVKGIQRIPGQKNYGFQSRNSDGSLSINNTITNATDIKNSLRAVKGYLSEGHLEAAYLEALSSGDENVLFELVDRTGPVLESLSEKTASHIVSTLTPYILEENFVSSVIPWLQQVVDLSAIHGSNYVVLSAKTKRDVLSAIQQAVNMEFLNGAERSVIQLAMTLRQIWGKGS